jgi:tetratricopeptide (TPR) repeat protein
LLGEAYLEKGMFRKAADKFFEVIRKGDDRFGPAGTDVAYYHKFKLTSKFANDNWKKIFYKNWLGVGAYEEYLFYIGFSSQYDQTNKLQDWTASSHGSYQVKPSNWITGQLNDLDEPYRGMGVSIKKDWDHNIIINKYNISRAAGIGDAGLIVNRAAKVHLMLAECYNRLGETDSALMIINKGIDLGSGYSTLGVRGRVALPAITPADTIVDENLTNWVEDLILDEGARELAFEGYRWYDLVRIATRRNDPSVLADRVAEKFPLDKQDEMREKFMDPENWYIPLFE